MLPGDAPLVRTETLASLIRAHRENEAAATLLTAVIADPTGYGRVIRGGDDRVSSIVEQSALAENQREINEINSSIYCFTLEKLWPALAQLKPNNAHHELYLTDAVDCSREMATKRSRKLADAEEILGCNTRGELAEADRILRQRITEKLMSEGVSIQFPETVVIDPDVRIGPDTLIENNVQLLGHTKIGANCVIRSGSVITDYTIGDGVVIKNYSVLNSSHLADSSQTGPFTRFREAVDLHEGARIGNFVEVKKSMIGEDTKAMHLTYLGDAKIGEQNKHRRGNHHLQLRWSEQTSRHQSAAGYLSAVIPLWSHQ